MKKILITGIAGFVGSSIAPDLLAKGYSVIGIDDLSFGYKERIQPFVKSITFVSDNILSESTRSLYHGVDTVIHLAAIAPLPENQIQPSKSLLNNVAATAAVLENSRLAGVKNVLFMSSGAVYERNIKMPFKEDDPVNPILLYPLGKYMAEKVCKSFVDCYGMNVACFRLFNLYGPRQDYFRTQLPLIGLLMKSAVLGNEAVLYSSSSMNTRDYIYIDDLSRMITAYVESNLEGYVCVNACSETSYSVPDIVEAVSQVVGAKIKHRYAEPKEFWHKYPTLSESKYPIRQDVVENEVNKRSLGCSSKMSSLLGIRASVPLHSGLAECYDYASKYIIRNR
jgi:nucleoside-diphosphate-sugar epimerase